MDSSESLADQISRLRGAINNTRSQQPKEITNINQPYSAAPRGRGYSRGWTRGRGSFRGRGGPGFRGRGGFPIQNRTLIVNNQGDDSGFVSTVSSNGRKLINKQIYEQELKEKNLTKEEKTERLRNAQEKIRLKKLETRISRNRVKLDVCDRCLIDGDLYAITKYGAKLIPLDIPSGIKPMKLQWNGYEYTRNKTGALKLSNQKVFLKEQCRYFQKTGQCMKEDTCRYAHNKSKISLCKNFVKGLCQGNCTLSHEPSEFNVPTCRFFMNDSCKNPECLFAHVIPELELVCRPFAIGGYCFRGKNCKFVHSYDCPDFQLTEQCPRGKNCKLKHHNRNNLDAKLSFNTLDTQYFELLNLTKMNDLHDDPRIQKLEIEQDQSEQDSDSDDDDNVSVATGTDSLERNADFIHF